MTIKRSAAPKKPRGKARPKGFPGLSFEVTLDPLSIVPSDSFVWNQQFACEAHPNAVDRVISYALLDRLRRAGRSGVPALWPAVLHVTPRVNGRLVTEVAPVRLELGPESASEWFDPCPNVAVQPLLLALRERVRRVKQPTLKG